MSAPASTGSRPSWSVSIGHVAGIDVRVHATFLVLVALFALAGSEPGGPGVTASLLWLVAIFACVIAMSSRTASSGGAAVRWCTRSCSCRSAGSPGSSTSRRRLGTS